MQFGTTESWVKLQVKNIRQRLFRERPWVFVDKKFVDDFLTEMMVIIGMTPEQAYREAILYADACGSKVAS